MALAIVIYTKAIQYAFSLYVVPSASHLQRYVLDVCRLLRPKTSDRIPP